MIPDMEKLIKGLEELSSFLFKEYGKAQAEEESLYYDRFLAVDNAIALLKKQQKLIDDIMRRRQTMGSSIDKEKVIKAWEIFRDSNPYEICSGREFRAIREPEYCMGQMIEDTIALLKEQDTAKPKRKHSGGGTTMWYECGQCNKPIDPNDKFCRLKEQEKETD